ncbi:dynamin family protein [Anaeromicropila populeti]|uniref:Dynamin family protein n=1 Tax=Anaeromicropila populeti TaxID=37658 RepID=A0A1I6HLQ3_9FIRM|nr:dynamin family protein [Anaeromicropila populeti]SFR55328.1 Dynamin family protein [Anaeromicropila populeti]
MEIFDRTREDELKFEAFTKKVDTISEELKLFESEIALSDIDEIKQSFMFKTKDFFREDRKLNIGIIGRVKAGKSTFLNAFLFGGKNVLPMAATPKTATLTRIEYAENNSIEIEYYSKDEWTVIENNAKVKSQKGEYAVGREIISMVKESGLNAADYIGKDKVIIEFDTYDELMKDLNDYVGENGKYTPVVKSVVLYVDKEELEDISIVDTPGLNDPIASRTFKTKRFIELCDVVFFLSKATSFLDINDLELLVAQLPQKGVKKLVLICSRFDDGLRDILWDKKEIAAAVAENKQKLRTYAERTLNNYKKNNFFIRDDVITQCKNPVFISSIVHNMSHKNPDEYNEQEKRIYDDLNLHKDLTKEILSEIGNMEEITEIFNEVVEVKEEILEEKAGSFVPTAMEELRAKLIRIEKNSERRIMQLNRYDREQILEQKKQFTSQIHAIESNLEEIFGTWCAKIENNKTQAIRDLRGYYRDYLQLSEKEGIKTHFETKAVSTSRWFMPWTWGNSMREIYSYDERYKYIDASDALENIRNFANDAASCIEDTFNKSLDIALTKRQLLNTVIENFDVTDDSYTPTYYKLMVERVLNSIKLPVISIDVSVYLSNIAAQFFGEIRDNATRTDLKRVLSNVISDLFNEICRRFEQEVKEFKEKVEAIKQEFSNNLLEDIHRELNQVLEQFDDKENEIKRYYQLLDTLKRINSDLNY